MPETSIRRIKPTDVPFDPDMSDAEVERLVGIAAFENLDADYRDSTAFRQSLRTHSRVVRVREGDVIIREGDWGNSAFFIITGTVAVLIGSERYRLTDELSYRRQPKSLWQSIAQLWSNHAHPETRAAGGYRAGMRLSTEGRGRQTRLFLQDVPSIISEFESAFIYPGGLFGELSALGRTARTTSVFARNDGELLEVRWQGLRDIMRRDRQFRARIEKTFADNALSSFLRSSPLFRHLESDEQALDDLVAQTRVEIYGEYDRVATFKQLAAEGAATDFADERVIAEEGHYANGVTFIRTGLARVSRRYHRGHRTHCYLTPGKMFGFEEIAESSWSGQPAPLKFSLRAIGFMTAVVVPTPTIEKYVLDRADAIPMLQAMRERSDAQPSVTGLKASPIGEDMIDFFVGQRFVNGTATMLINLDRCTRCDDCVRACASAHDNNPRFLRTGPIHDNLMVANACMHCQDPVCMIECPTGAIGRRLDEGEVVINDATCVGCGACARNCPYDAIRMVEIRDPSGRFIRDESTPLHTPITKATKCDLCVEQLGGPACQRACPHDALLRIDMGNVDALGKWLKR